MLYRKTTYIFYRKNISNHNWEKEKQMASRDSQTARFWPHKLKKVALFYFCSWVRLYTVGREEFIASFLKKKKRVNWFVNEIFLGANDKKTLVEKANRAQLHSAVYLIAVRFYLHNQRRRTKVFIWLHSAPLVEKENDLWYAMINIIFSLKIGLNSLKLTQKLEKGVLVIQIFVAF